MINRLDELFREKTIEERIKSLEEQVCILNQHRLNDVIDLLKMLEKNGLKTQWSAIPKDNDEIDWTLQTR